MSVSTSAGYLTSGQVALLLMVSKGTVLRAVRSGTLHVVYTMPGGGLRFMPQEVERYRQSLQPAPQLRAAGAPPAAAGAAHAAGAATAGAGMFPAAASGDPPAPAVTAGTAPGLAESIGSVLALLAESVRVGATCVARHAQGSWQIEQLYDRAGMSLRVGTALPYSSVYGRALAEGRLPSLIVDDLRADARFAGATDNSTWRLGAFAVVPLAWSDGHLFGALCLLHPSARPRLREEMSQLRLAARIIMLALEAADLLEQAQAARHSLSATARLLAINDELAVLARESRRKARGLERTVARLQAEHTPRHEAAASLGPDA